MDWKRIMNKRQKKTDRREAAEEAAKKEIQRYFVRLIPEINLRLLLDMEPPTILWVEAITVTGFQAASCATESKGRRFIPMWRNFIKNKKERR